jgi:hypothetical protein
MPIAASWIDSITAAFASAQESSPFNDSGSNAMSASATEPAQTWLLHLFVATCSRAIFMVGKVSNMRN